MWADSMRLVRLGRNDQVFSDIANAKWFERVGSVGTITTGRVCAIL